MKKFEYKTYNYDSEMRSYHLDEHGENGWELVNLVIFQKTYKYIFKREVQ